MDNSPFKMASISDMISEDTPVVQERWFHDEPKDCFYVGNFSSPRSPPHETTPVNMKWVVKHRYSDSALANNPFPLDLALVLTYDIVQSKIQS